jgi:hypothetical protein
MSCSVIMYDIFDQYCIFTQIKKLTRCNEDFLIAFCNTHIFNDSKLFTKFSDIYILVATSHFPSDKLTKHGRNILNDTGYVVLGYMLMAPDIKHSSNYTTFDGYHFIDSIQSTKSTNLNVFKYMIQEYQDLYLRSTDRDIDVLPITIESNFKFWRKYFRNIMMNQPYDLEELQDILDISLNYDDFINYLRTKCTKII